MQTEGMKGELDPGQWGDDTCGSGRQTPSCYMHGRLCKTGCSG